MGGIKRGDHLAQIHHNNYGGESESTSESGDDNKIKKEEK